MHLTLPTEARTIQMSIGESAPLSSQLDSGWLSLGLEWDSDFRPDAIQEVSPLEGKGRRFRLIDVNEKSATLNADVSIEPVNDNGKLVIHVAMSNRDAKDFGAVTGQVLDRDGRPIAGAFAGLATLGGYRVSDELRHQSTTNAQGWYRLRDIPRRRIDGAPIGAANRGGERGLRRLRLGAPSPEGRHDGKVPTRRSHSLGARCLAEWRRRRSSRATGGRGLGPVQQACPLQWIIPRRPGSPDG